MNNSIESTSRTPADYFLFAVGCLGKIIAVAGVITSSVATAVCGLVLIAIGLAYFSVQSCLQD